MTNVVEKTKKRIDDTLQARQKELQYIQDKYAEAVERSAAADIALRTASEKLDLPAYESALEEQKAADTAAKMYAARLEQIKKLEAISETESDKVLSDLEAYQNEATAKFEQDIAVHYAELRKLLDAYTATIDDAEDTIDRWQNEVHRYYHHRGTTFPDGTDRDGKPVKFHAVRYTGCIKSVSLRDFLNGEGVN